MYPWLVPVESDGAVSVSGILHTPATASIVGPVLGRRLLARHSARTALNTTKK